MGQQGLTSRNQSGFLDLQRKVLKKRFFFQSWNHFTGIYRGFADNGVRGIPD
jgi:hypothetical protein